MCQSSQSTKKVTKFELQRLKKKTIGWVQNKIAFVKTTKIVAYTNIVAFTCFQEFLEFFEESTQLKYI